MNKDFIPIWLKSGILRKKQVDFDKFNSLINSAECTMKVVRSIKLSEESATLIFRETYESIRQLGEAKWDSLGYEPTNHEISLDILKELDISEKIKLNSLDRFKRIRHDINYRGFKASLVHANEILAFWNSCGEEILKNLKRKIEK